MGINLKSPKEYKNLEIPTIKKLISLKKKNYLNKKIPKSEEYPYEIHDPYLVTQNGDLYKKFYLVGNNWLNDNHNDLVVVLGCNDWKFGFISEYLDNYKVAFLPRKKIGLDTFFLIKKLNIKPKAVIIWGYNEKASLRFLLDTYRYNIWRIEDGFIRSSSLGASHSTPYSLVIDKKGLYYNDKSNSDLISLLNTYEFSKTREELNEAEICLDMMAKFSLSKYNPPTFNMGGELKIKKRIAILGQVDNDAAIRYGNPDGWTSNTLVELAYLENPGCEILYRPHPEIYKGYQKSKLRRKSLEKIAKIVSPEENIISFIEKCDHVYTITSLTGLEALVRGKKVTVVGTPFYAGWGLTDDRANIKRERQLDIKELFYLIYLKYPKYFKESNNTAGFSGASYSIVIDREINTQRETIKDISPLPKAGTLNNQGQLTNLLFSSPSDKIIENIFSFVMSGGIGKTLSRFKDDNFSFLFSCYLIGKSIKQPNLIDLILKKLKESLRDDIFNDVMHLLYSYHLVREHKNLNLYLIYYKNGLSLISKEIDHQSTIDLTKRLSQHSLVADLSTKRSNNEELTEEKEIEQLPSLQEINEHQEQLIKEAIITSFDYGKYEEGIKLVSELFIAGKGDKIIFERVAKAYNESMQFNTAYVFYKFLISGTVFSTKASGQLYDLIRTSIFSENQNSFDEIFKNIAIVLKTSPDKYLSSVKLLDLALSKFNYSDERRYEYKKILTFIFNSLPMSLDVVSSLLDLREYDKAKNILNWLAIEHPNKKKIAIYYSYYYTLIGDIYNAKMILKNYINDTYDDEYLVREYLRVIRIAGDFHEGMEIIEKAKYNGININPVLLMPFLQGVGDVKLAYKTYTLIPFRDKIIRYFGKKYLADTERNLIRKKILILAGWGPGDEIRFSSLYQQIDSYFKESDVTFSCDYRLYDIFKESYPDLKFIPTHRTRDFDFQNNNSKLFSEVKSSDFSTLFDSSLLKELEGYDHFVLGSDLIHLFMDYKNAPISKRTYMPPKENKEIHLKNKDENILYIGINWRSSLDDKSRYVHYFDIEDFSPLLENENIKLISLQYDSFNEQERTWIEGNYPGFILEPIGLDQYNDLSSVSSLITQLDCVIAPCTTVAELSGALGKKTFFISKSAEIKWRCLEDDTDYWFNSIEHIIPDVALDKKSVLDKLFRKVEILFKNKKTESFIPYAM